MHTRDTSLMSTFTQLTGVFLIGKEINNEETSCLHFCFTERMNNILFYHSIREAELFGTSVGFVEEKGGRE